MAKSNLPIKYKPSFMDRIKRIFSKEARESETPEIDRIAALMEINATTKGKSYSEGQFVSEVYDFLGKVNLDPARDMGAEEIPFVNSREYNRTFTLLKRDNFTWGIDIGAGRINTYLKTAPVLLGDDVHVLRDSMGEYLNVLKYSRFIGDEEVVNKFGRIAEKISGGYDSQDEKARDRAGKLFDRTVRKDPDYRRAVTSFWKVCNECRRTATKFGQREGDQSDLEAALDSGVAGYGTLADRVRVALQQVDLSTISSDEFNTIVHNVPITEDRDEH